MKEKELVKLRKEYNKMIKNRNRLQKIMDRMAKLEQLPEVKKYKKLLEEFEERRSIFADEKDIKSDEEIVLEVARRSAVTPTTNVYFYFVTRVFSCKYNKYMNVDIPCKEDTILYYIFHNAELPIGLPLKECVRPDELEEFTKNNIVVYPTNKHYSASFCKEANYKFVADEIIYGEEKTIKKYKKYAKKGYPWGK